MCGGGGGFNPIQLITSGIGFLVGGPEGAMIGSALGGAIGGSKSSTPAPAAAPAAAAVAAPIPAPQASVTPEVNTVRNQVAGTTGDGQASTLLTGLGGVDPKTLQLGKSTLLGE